jgi:cyclase
MKMTDRRTFLMTAMGGLTGLACAPLAFAKSSRLAIQSVAGKVSVVTGAPGNVIALTASDGAVLVDSGSMEMAKAVKESLANTSVRSLFNTHYHADQTGGNALFNQQGAVIHAHVITKQWLAADYYLPAEDRWVKAPAKEAVPSVTFRDKGEIKAGDERIEYGYLLEAHTRGDIYVYFRDSNVLAVGDVVSPLRDPALDWFAGGWIGGRVDAMDDLLALANENTKIVPAYGAVMSRAELQAERNMMLKLYDRTSQATAKGRSAEDMLNDGVMNEIDRKFKDPDKFLYDVAKGLQAHYTNFGGNVV